jgi:predicted metal-dependent phosphotriesterase family hydrolase
VEELSPRLRDRVKRIQTVLGPIDPNELGVTLPHEHLRLDLFRAARSGGRPFELPLEVMVEEVLRFRRAGGGAIVELTTPDLGRSPTYLQEVSRRTGVHIIMSTGRYREPWYEKELWERTTASIAREFIDEIERGVDGVRAGIIGEIGVHAYHISPVEERVHRAAARAQKATGLSISTHALFRPVGLLQLDLFAEEGVDLRRVIIGHCETFPHLEYHEEIMKRGAWVAFDQVRGRVAGSEFDIQTQTRLIPELIRRGHAGQLLLSQDICDHTRLHCTGGPGFTYIVDTFRGILQSEGVSSEDIHTLLVDNPRRALTGEA